MGCRCMMISWEEKSEITPECSKLWKQFFHVKIAVDKVQEGIVWSGITWNASDSIPWKAWWVFFVMWHPVCLLGYAHWTPWKEITHLGRIHIDEHLLHFIHTDTRFSGNKLQIQILIPCFKLALTFPVWFPLSQDVSPVFPYLTVACVFAFVLSFGLGPGKRLKQ